jgi:hypothetical protein
MLGALGEDCPKGSEGIYEKQACKDAAAAVGRGKDFRVLNDDASDVLGCFLKDETVYFNPNLAAAGTNCAACRLLCMGMPASAFGLRHMGDLLPPALPPAGYW